MAVYSSVTCHLAWNSLEAFEEISEGIRVLRTGIAVSLSSGVGEQNI